jgi:hypothetical protein
MSEDDYQRIVERVSQSVAQPMIATDTGLEAAQQMGQMATQEEIEFVTNGRRRSA